MESCWSTSPAPLAPEAFGAVPDGRADCSDAINAALAGGRTVRLTPGGTYRIRRQVRLTAGCRLIGDRTSRIVASARDFRSTARRAGTSDSSLIAADKADDIVLSGMRIEFEAAPESWVSGVQISSARRALVHNVDMSGFNRGDLVALDSCFDSAVTDCTLRDSRIDASTTGQLTGVSVDDNRRGGVDSRNVGILRNTIRSLTVTPAFDAAFGYQTDGVNIAGAGRESFKSGIVISGNVISDCGEGIDTFGKAGVITDNVIIDVVAGIKLAHGSSDNLISGNTIDGVAVWGIVLGGARLTLSAANRNVIDGNAITRVGIPKGATRGAIAAIRFVSGVNQTRVTNTTIVNNRIYATPGASFAVIVSDGGGPPQGVLYASNYYDGSAKQGEIDDMRQVTYRPFIRSTGGASYAGAVPPQAVARLATLRRDIGLGLRATGGASQLCVDDGASPR